jgi:hypothetical protein
MAFTNMGQHCSKKHAMIWIHTHHPSFHSVLDFSICNVNLSKPYGYYRYHLL